MGGMIITFNLTKEEFINVYIHIYVYIYIYIYINSYIYIYWYLNRDGNTESSTLLHKLHGNEHFADVESSGNHLHIKFTSDVSQTRPGFYISWEFKSRFIFWVSLWLKK